MGSERSFPYMARARAAAEAEATVLRLLDPWLDECDESDRAKFSEAERKLAEAVEAWRKVR